MVRFMFRQGVHADTNARGATPHIHSRFTLALSPPPPRNSQASLFRSEVRTPARRSSCSPRFPLRETQIRYFRPQERGGEREKERKREGERERKRERKEERETRMGMKTEKKGAGRNSPFCRTKLPGVARFCFQTALALKGLCLKG